MLLQFIPHISQKHIRKCLLFWVLLAAIAVPIYSYYLWYSENGQEWLIGNYKINPVPFDEYYKTRKFNLLMNATLDEEMFGGIGKITSQWLSSNDSNPIPMIFHQSWKTAELPTRFNIWRDTCVKANSDYTFHLWDDTENRKLVEKYLPDFLPVYDAFEHGIYRADFVRYLYMYVFGGIYSDLDLECLRPISEYFSERKRSNYAYLASMVTSYGGRPHRLPNAWIASTPRHPFWLHVLNYSMVKARLLCYERASIYYTDGCDAPEHITGPVAVSASFDEYEEDPPIGVLEPHMIFPYSWDVKSPEEDKYCNALSGEFSREKCHHIYKDQKPYTITYWSHTRGDFNHEEDIK